MLLTAHFLTETLIDKHVASDRDRELESLEQ